MTIWNSQLLSSSGSGGLCFGCVNETRCGVVTPSPIMPGLLGDPGSQLLVLGEAPSWSGTGTPVPLCSKPAIINRLLHFGQLTSSLATSPGAAGRSHLGVFLGVLYAHFNRWPFFLDLARCGTVVTNKSLINLRIGFCVPLLLWDEISLIKPTEILCCGWNVFRRFNLEMTRWQVNPAYSGWRTALGKTPIQVRLLYHYSGRSPRWPLLLKQTYAWKVQLGALGVAQPANCWPAIVAEFTF